MAGTIRLLLNRLHQLHGFKRLAASAVEDLIARIVVHALKTHGAGRVLDLKFGQIVDRHRVVVTAQGARQRRAHTDGADGGEFPGFRWQRAIQPSIAGRLAARRAGFHIILRVEVRAGRVGGADGFDNGELLRIVNRLQGRKGRVQTEHAVQVDGGFGSAVGTRDGDRRPHFVIALFAVRDDDVQTVHSPTLEDRDQNFLARRRRVRCIERPGKPRRRGADADHGQCGTF